MSTLIMPSFLLLFLVLGLHLHHAAIFDIINQCPYTVWAAAIPCGGQALVSGQNWTINVNARMDEARIWARTGCTFNNSGHGNCLTGDCNGLLECQTYGTPPNTLARFTLNGFNNLDFFDISLAQGFNVPMDFSPTAGCDQRIRCTADINGQCPTELQSPGQGGCNDPCTVFGTDEYCCYSGDSCGPTKYSNFFKGLCPDVLSYPMDDPTNSTFTCIGGTDYKVVFCPNNNFFPAEDFITSHNLARNAVAVSPVTWDTTLEDYAKNYANERIGDCNLVHSRGPYGENLFWGTGTGFTPADAVNAWVSEKQYYDHDNNTCASGMVCAHYTQVVWRSSTSIGCASLRCNNGPIFTICSYKPPGNVIGRRPY